MFYLQNFLFIFSLRFGCRLIASAEIIIYAYGVYYVYTEFGFEKLLDSMILVSLAASFLLSCLMVISTLQEHESTGILFTYLIWGIFTTIFLDIFYIFCFIKYDRFASEYIFAGLLIATTLPKCYAMLVVLSFMHMLVSSDSEDSS
ncbi:hypothetical protein ACLKA6_000741 [Drosophila palustris]